MLTKDDLLAIKGLLQPLESDVGILKGDVGSLKNDVGSLKNDVGILKNDVGSLKNDAVTLMAGMGKLNKKVDNLTTELKRTEKRLQKSINTLTDDVGDSIWKLEDKMERVETKLGFATN